MSVTPEMMKALCTMLRTPSPAWMTWLLHVLPWLLLLLTCRVLLALTPIKLLLLLLLLLLLPRTRSAPPVGGRQCKKTRDLLRNPLAAGKTGSPEKRPRLSLTGQQQQTPLLSPLTPSIPVPSLAEPPVFGGGTGIALAGSGSGWAAGFGFTCCCRSPACA